MEIIFDYWHDYLIIYFSCKYGNTDYKRILPLVKSTFKPN